ncbi:hypothetical protein FNV43_RR27283 [Rhamnella rubrinervis]|uniref:Ubiquitin-like protease family profile domain-containing protein n=1 Tax=Rhamnella rubrinervis TaxID=2594499 RepID=A0A8K0DQX7_9ROSA|nr:hypothetical protein FNV43_RR27283 [Rhamnella rubrinervis]
MASEVEESSNALQTGNLGYSSVKYVEASTKLAEGVSSYYIRDTLRPNLPRHRPSWPRGVSCYIRDTPRLNLPRHRPSWPRGVLLLYTGYPSPKCAEASATLAKRIIPEGVGDIAHLTVISNLQMALKVIYNKLQKGIDQFEASIFSDFIRMKTIQFCGGFVHHLLLRQLYNDDPHVIEFKFNRVGAWFDRKAFAIFTGLNCGKLPKKLEMRNLSYSLWTKYFGESGPMTQTEFSQTLKDIEFKYDNDQEIWDNVKSPEPEPEQEQMYTTRASTQSQPEGAHSQHLEGMINELREDFANMRANFGLQLAQQDSDIRELKTIVGQLLQHHKQQQIVAYTPPPPSPAPEQELHHPIHVVWDPFKPADKKKKAALSKFLKDRKSKLSTVDGFDKISKEVYNLFLASGGWLNNDGMDVVLYFIRKRIDGNSGLFPSNVIIADCFFCVYIPVNNNGTYWLTVKVDIPSRHIILYNSAIKMMPNGDCDVYALKYIEYLIAGRPFDFNSSHIALFREKYAVEIFHNEI